MRLGVAVGNRTRDLLHCRQTLYAKSHSNGVTKHYLGTSIVLLQIPTSVTFCFCQISFLDEIMRFGKVLPNLGLSTILYI
jgi:hypothetical protein